MKIRPFVLFAALLLVSTALHAAQVPKLETLLAEYKKARTEVLGKLKEAYASQADMLAEQYLAMPGPGPSRTRPASMPNACAIPTQSMTPLEASFSVNDPPTVDPITLMQAELCPRPRGEPEHCLYLLLDDGGESAAASCLQVQRQGRRQGPDHLSGKDQTGRGTATAAIATAAPRQTAQSYNGK